MLERTVHIVLCYSSCDDLTPSDGEEPQNDPSPFIITTETQTLTSCEQLKVSLENGHDEHLKSFIVQARSTDTQEVVGTFFQYSVISVLLLKYLDCGNGTKNTVTHKNGFFWKEKVVDLIWAPDEDFTGDIYFVASFVYNVTAFWTNVTSQLVSVNNKGLLIVY